MKKHKISTKILMKFIFNQMKKLDENEITVEQARAQSNLIKQANNLFKYELDKAKVLMFLNRYNKVNQEKIEIKTLENE